MKRQNKVTLAILGPPGSGKGTQARFLAQKFNLSHIELGNLIRELIKKDKKAKVRYDQGIPQPDDLIEKILENEIARLTKKRIIIDPFPLTQEQIEILDRLVKKYHLAQPKVIYLKTNAQAVMKRMLTRGENRGDDNPSTARKRIKIYQQSLTPVLAKLKKRGQLVEIDGNPAIAEVSKQIFKKLNYEYPH